jgi:hypothetical protein
MSDTINKEKSKLVDDEIIDLSDFNSIEIQGNKSSNKDDKLTNQSVRISKYNKV